MNVRLETPRLTLRPFLSADVDDRLTMDGDERVMRYIGTGLGPRTRAEVEASRSPLPAACHEP